MSHTINFRLEKFITDAQSNQMNNHKHNSGKKSGTTIHEGQVTKPLAHLSKRGVLMARVVPAQKVVRSDDQDIKGCRYYVMHIRRTHIKFLNQLILYI